MADARHADRRGFKNQGDCVNDGAQGIVLFAGKPACMQAGGTFVVGGIGPGLWQCNEYPISDDLRRCPKGGLPPTGRRPKLRIREHPDPSPEQRSVRDVGPREPGERGLTPQLGARSGQR